MTATPLIKLDNFYLKREDYNQTGSAKDRALIKQIANLQSHHISDAVISSTGNAALSAIFFCHQANINLTIFLSPKINPHKLALLQEKNAHLITSLNPIKAAFQFSQLHQAFFLRQSTDPNALLGYQSLGQELIEQLPQISSLFIAVGSGTTLLGLSQALPSSVKLYPVQPASNPTIASFFDHTYQAESSTITDALSVKYLPLKNQVISAITKSQGQGIVVQNHSVIDTLKFLETHGITTSAEGALALAGLRQAQSLNLPIGDFPVVVLTGAKR